MTRQERTIKGIKQMLSDKGSKIASKLFDDDYTLLKEQVKQVKQQYKDWVDIGLFTDKEKNLIGQYPQMCFNGYDIIEWEYRDQSCLWIAREVSSEKRNTYKYIFCNNDSWGNLTSSKVISYDDKKEDLVTLKKLLDKAVKLMKE